MLREREKELCVHIPVCFHIKVRRKNIKKKIKNNSPRHIMYKTLKEWAMLLFQTHSIEFLPLFSTASSLPSSLYFICVAFSQFSLTDRIFLCIWCWILFVQARMNFHCCCWCYIQTNPTTIIKGTLKDDDDYF